MSEVGFVIADAALAKLDGGLLGEAYRKYLPELKATLAEFPELQADYEGLVKLA